MSYRKGYRSMNGTEIKYMSDWARQHQLEGDGLIPLLYDHLNKSDRTKEHRLKNVPIPDTVIFDHNFPRAWYAYDFKGQEIVKRPGKMLESQSIYEYFSGEESGVEDPCTDIVAQFFSKKSSVNVASSPRQLRREQHLRQASMRGSMVGLPKSPRRPGTRGSEATVNSTAGALTTPRGGGSVAPEGSTSRTGSVDGGRAPRPPTVDEDDDDTGTSVEFFTRETLFDFVFNQKVKPDGVLQRFVVPKGQPSTMRNFMLQAVWSPLVSLVYKRTSIKRMSDHTGSTISERAATFDGPPHYSTESLVAQGTKDAINAICKRIVKHFFITEHKPITRMVLYFKVDQEDNLVLLWSSSIRVGGDKLNPSYLRVPLHLALKVDNARSRNKNDVDPDTKLLRDVLKEDVAMYNLTGDLAFAHMCRETVIGKRNGDTATENPHTGAEGDHELQSNHTATTTRGRAESTERAASEKSAESSPRNSPRRYYVSSRAPFLIQDYPPENLPVSSARHPLHQAYVDLYGEADSLSTDQALGATVGSGSGLNANGKQSQRRRQLAQAQKRAGTTLTAAERLAKRTDKDLLLSRLKDAISDTIYQAHSSILDGNLSVGTGMVPQVSVQVELDGVVYDALDQPQLNDVLEMARLIPDRTDENMFTEQERADFRRSQLRAAAKNGVGVVGRRSFLVGYDTTAQPALAGTQPPHRHPLNRKELIKQGVDVDQLDAEQRDAAIEYLNKRSQQRHELRGDGDSRLLLTDRPQGAVDDNERHSSDDEDNELKYAFQAEEERRMSRYRPGMKFTVVPGTLGRGFRRDRPIAQIIRDVGDYLDGLLENPDVAEELMNRVEAATIERENASKGVGVAPPSLSLARAAKSQGEPQDMSPPSNNPPANGDHDDNSSTADDVSDVPTASSTRNSFAQRSGSTARSDAASHSQKEA